MTVDVRPFRRSDATTVVDERAPVVEEEIVQGPPPAGPPPPPRPLLWPWLLLLLLLVAGGLVAAWWFTRDNGNKSSASTVNVPNVVRLKQQDAVSRLNQRGLVARISTRTSSAPPGTVVAQDPGPGANVTRHSVVTLGVSSAQTSAVPDVVGKRAPGAVTALRAKGFAVKTVSVASKKPQGTVLAQTPGAGDRIARGSTVTIRVSRGLVTVPDVLGQQRDTAVAAIRGAGLKPKAFVVSSTQKQGVVVAQDPQAGKRIAGGSTVRLNVSNGSSGSAAPPPPPSSTAPASVDVPDVTGQGQAAAQKQLSSAGLKAGVVYVKSDQPQGTVVSQSPPGGKTVKRGTRVQLNVALGSKPGTLKGVPEVRNLSPSAARAKLSAAGFVVQTLQQPVGDRAQVGKVVDEQPAGGRNAPAGSVITIYVGRKA
ncbi:MAG TPA: PASTA domain-containing protein [Gaiellaceae bacterium]|nr:PASTA domain-containing protein [Gaiellaceae bacterium]